MFLILFATLACLTATNAKITNCAKPGSLFTVDALGFWPDPAKSNENSTVSFLYTVPEPGFTGGTATYTVTYNFIPLTPTVEDLCKNIACPILPGQYNQTTTSIFPAGLSGTMTTKIRYQDTNGAELLCALISTQV